MATTRHAADSIAKQTRKRKINVVEYGEAALAIFGDTFTIKEDLKSIGAKFNKSLLQDGERVPGWILPKKSRSKLASIGIITTSHEPKCSETTVDSATVIQMQSIPKDKKSPIAAAPQSTMCFLAHDWGKDERGRENHERVTKVNKILQDECGLTTWFDAQRLKGNIRAQMAQGIENTKCVVVFVTDRYRKKVNNDREHRDHCRYEFCYAVEQIGPQRMIAVVMEEQMKVTRDWKGELGAALGGQKYIDMIEDDEVIFREKCHELADEIRRVADMNESIDDTA